MSAGKVLVGGVDVRELDGRALMDQVSFVFQDTRLFQESLLENIRAGRPGASREEVLAAAQAARCGDILDKLPQGLDTVVGSQGTFLSGGEAQRIALARAILKDAPIVVLDEATAFADPENERQIQAALDRLDPRQDGADDRPPAVHHSERRPDSGPLPGQGDGAGDPQGPGRRRGALRPDVGGLPAQRPVEGRKGGSGMMGKLQHMFALSEKGARDLVKAVFWSFLCNLSLMLPVGVTMAAVQYLLAILEGGGDPMARFWVCTAPGYWRCWSSLSCTTSSTPPSTWPPIRRVPAGGSAWPRPCGGCPCPSSAAGISAI